MIKNENLYAEEVIVESPFFYDENGRLRARVLEEQQRFVASDDLRLDPKTGKKGPSVLVPVIEPKEDDEEAQTRREYAEKKGMVIRDMRARSPEEKARERQKDEEDYQKFKQEKAARKGGLTPMPEKKPGVPVEKTDMPNPPVRNKPTQPTLSNSRPRPPGAAPLPIARDERAVPPTQGNTKTDPGIRMDAKPERPVRTGKSFRDFRMGRNAARGPGRNVNVRPVRPVARRMMEDSRPATDYIEEKINLKTAEMGDVIRDFQKSDAPQFKGKSKEKRRMMAIAAKLQAERG